MRVDVDRFLSAGREMSSDDLSGDLPSFVEGGVVAETSVSLARRPEVNVFMAELFLEKLLKKWATAKLIENRTYKKPYEVLK